jgi:putative hydrolase of HD superfamily
MNVSRILKLFKDAGKLKSIKRTGWTRHNIPEPESVADHSFRVAFMSMVMADRLNVDALKLIKMGLIHDMAESITGDITPDCGVSPEEKHVMEKEALLEVFGKLPDGSEFVDLWLEYEENKSPEARALKNIDKLEMAFQAVEYQEEYNDKDLSEFISSAHSNIDMPEIFSMLKELIKKSQSRHSGESRSPEAD